MGLRSQFLRGQKCRLVHNNGYQATVEVIGNGGRRKVPVRVLIVDDSKEGNPLKVGENLSVPPSNLEKPGKLGKKAR